MTTHQLKVAYSPDYLNWQLGSGDGNHPTQPIRARIALEWLKEDLGSEVDVIDPDIKRADRRELETIHHPAFVSEVLDLGECADWTDSRPQMGQTALKMFSGTARLVEMIIRNQTKIGFNPQGAKHHAQYRTSEGFCVFNDFAWAAKAFERAGLKVVYIDWDVNAGDGVQNLLADTDIPTFSIHGHGIYPTHSDTWNGDYENKKTTGNYTWHNEEQHWYNWCLTRGEGDAGFKWAIDEIAKKVAEYKPDVILLATGADGHEGENWGLKYTFDGYAYASKVIAELANKYADGRVLIGGAGGYQPYTHTPRIWANVVRDIYTQTNEGETNAN